MKNKKKFGKLYRHEALDRAYIMGSVFDDTITQHYVFKKHPELRKKADKIAELLAELYQDTANLK